MKRSLLLAVLLLPAVASAHRMGVPTTAWFTEPEGVGIVVDESFAFAWTDYDDTADTEHTTIDFYFTPAMPPTYRIGTVPSQLDGTPIVKSVPELDPTNRHVWNTTEVPSGSYFLFSIAHDNPFTMVVFARGVVTVAHEGDPIHPAIFVTEPDVDREAIARGHAVIRWLAFDPDESGRVRIEVTRRPDGSDLVTLAEDLDPSIGRFVWMTDGFEPGEWMVRATLEDGRGLVHQAWSRSFVQIEGQGGAGGEGGVGGDGGAGGAGGAGGDGEGGAGGAGGNSGAGGGGGAGGASGGAGGGAGAGSGYGGRDRDGAGGCSSAGSAGGWALLLALSGCGLLRRPPFGRGSSRSLAKGGFED